MVLLEHPALEIATPSVSGYPGSGFWVDPTLLRLFRCRLPSVSSAALIGR